MAHISLSFSNDLSVQLELVDFHHPLLKEPRRSIRGKTRGAWAGCHSFQWTFAVQALCLLLLRTKAVCEDTNLPPLVGASGSPAASLDYAISKQPLWLLDMFGLDGKGECLIRRLVSRTNPERRRGGDVAISIKDSQLSKDDIEIKVNGNVVVEREEILRIAESVEIGCKWMPVEQKETAVRVGIVPFDSPEKFNYCLTQGFSDEILLALSTSSVVKPVLLPEHGSRPERSKTYSSRCDLMIIGRIGAIENRFQLYVHLVHPRTGSVYWSQAYRGEIKSIGGVQRQLASDLSSNILKLTQEQEAVAG